MKTQLLDILTLRLRSQRSQKRCCYCPHVAAPNPKHSWQLLLSALIKNVRQPATDSQTMPRAHAGAGGDFKNYFWNTFRFIYFLTSERARVHTWVLLLLLLPRQTSLTRPAPARACVRLEANQTGFLEKFHRKPLDVVVILSHKELACWFFHASSPYNRQLVSGRYEFFISVDLLHEIRLKALRFTNQIHELSFLRSFRYRVLSLARLRPLIRDVTMWFVLYVNFLLNTKV